MGLVDVYNLLPAQVVCQKSVASMQALLKFRVRNGDSYWLHTFSPRVPLHELVIFLCFVDTFDDLSNSEDLRQHTGDA